jgi:MFS family permease
MVDLAPGRPLHPWRSVLILALTTIFASAEIAVVSAIFPVLRQQFRLTTAELSVFATIGLTARTLCGPLWGMLGDRFGRRRVLLVMVFVWSIVVAATGLAQTYSQLLVIYALAAVGAVGADPIINSLLADLFPESQRGKAFGFLRGVVGLGVAFRMPAAGLQSDHPDGWRIVFYCLGAAQLICGLLILVGVAEPSVGAADRLETQRPAKVRFRWSDVPTLWRVPSVRLLGLNYVLATSVVMLAYIPTFLTDVRHFSVTQSTRLYGIMHVGVVLGALIGGPLSDAIAVRHPARGRILLMQIYLLLFAAMTWFMFEVAWPNSGWYYACYFVFGVLFPIGFSGCVLPMLSAVVRPELRGTAFGLLASFLQGLSLIFVSLWLGAMANGHGLDQLLFWAVTVPYLVNAAMWALFYRTYPRDAEVMRRSLEAQERASA